MYNYKIDTKLLPNVFVTWATTKGGVFNERKWLNCKTGKIKTKPEPWMHYESEADINPGLNVSRRIGITWQTQHDPEIWVKNGTNVRYAYVKYHKDIDMLEVAAVGIDTTRKPEPHEWKYLGDRFFINRQKEIFDQDGHRCNTFYLYEYHTAYNPNVLFSMLYRLNYNNKAVEEFKKFIGKDFFTIGNGRCIAIERLYHIQEWYKTVQKTKGKGKEQKLADDLTSIALSDVSGLAEEYPVIDVQYDRSYYRGYTITIKNLAYFETVGDDWFVVRIFHRDDNNKLTEPYRLYLNNNGKLRFVSYGPTGWIPASIATFRYGHYNRLVNFDEAVEKCPKIKYAASAVDNKEHCEFFDRLLTSLRIPDIEQLSKLGCTKIVNNLFCSSYPKADLKRDFGGYYNEKESNILRKIGMTKPQLDCYMEQWNTEGYYKSPRGGLEEMRKIFGDDLSHLDIESYRKYLTGLCEIASIFWNPISNHAYRFDFDAERFTKNLIRIGEKNKQIYQTANDIIGLANRINNRPEINWYFDDYSEASRIHDALIEIARRQDEERRALWDLQAAERLKKEEEKRIKVDKERKQYEYEDDNYIIRLPKDSNEIVREGSKQHICIGGYTTRHAMGDTNLFFLREKSNPEEPFYAIEMNNNNIIQIHGFGNKWLGNNPEAIPTVIRWLRKNNIRCSNEILTCTSTGYGSNRQYVKMPVVD